MAVSSASRFAVLKVEDYDSDECSDSGNKDSKNTTTNNNDRDKKGKVPAVPVKNKSKKKKNTSNETAELQNLIFGTGKTKAKSNNNNQTKGPAKSSQWEEWKEKDDKFVTDSYEQDLQQALLLSKVQFEENKVMMNTVRAHQNLDRQQSGVIVEDSEEGSKKSKKKGSSSSRKDKGQGATTMTLGQFNNLLPSQIDAGVHNLVANGVFRPTENGVPEKPPVLASETDFFDKIEEDAGKIIRSEQRRDQFKKNEPFIAEQALSLELRDELEKKDTIIEELTSANTKLREELKSVKYRNKKLCSILGQGEMKDKAEILVQAEKLRNLRDELTEEVSSLHAALEQEKSKVHILQSELKKQQSGKKEQKKESTS